jgi:hypothetical protein
VVQVVESLASRCEALSSDSSTDKKIFLRKEYSSYIPVFRNTHNLMTKGCNKGLGIMTY